MKKLVIKTYLDHAQHAKESEQQGNYELAAKQWRSAWIAAPTETQTNWSFARAEYCFKKAIEEGQIKLEKTRQYDFKQFMGKRDA